MGPEMVEQSPVRLQEFENAEAPGIEMDGLTAEDFPAFFRDIHGYEAFPWQQRLTTQVLERDVWPKVIDLPTGTGKTAVLDTAVFVMAARPAISPRRIVFVIDRRIVVDQVCQRALRIQDRVKDGKTSVLQRVRERLRSLSGGEEVLGVAALRGGIPIDNEWTHRPDQPWVVVTTVDQFGSRLLFRGYGVAPGMRPIHAGLAGNDCLVILDEVHLSAPFAETLAQVAALDPTVQPRRFSTVEMSATPNDTEAERFRLDPIADLERCNELCQRVKASKQAKLISVADHNAIPAAVMKIVKSITKSSRTGVNVYSVGVVVNRVRTARETYRALKEGGYSTFLITGRMRPLDRADVLTKIGPVVDPARKLQQSDLTVVVATQAIEVGADFSFDALVTECAAVDSLRQRFGRLDRRGRFSQHGLVGLDNESRAWIIGPKSVVSSKKPDPIYGESIKATWEELERRNREGPIDVGPLSLREFPDDATTPRANAPLLLKTHMDTWTQTSPEPIVQPSIDWFLHGIDRDWTADVSIVWRFDRSSEALRLVPPRQAEFLQVPIDAAKSWLSGSKEVDIADVAQCATNHEEFPSSSDDNATDWVRWEGFGKELQKNMKIDTIRPGDVLIVDPNRGGVRAGTWDPSSSELVADLGDEAQMAYGRRATLRLDPRLFDSHSLPKPVDGIDADSPDRDRISQWLSQWQNDPGEQAEWFTDAVERLCRDFDLTPIGLDNEASNEAYYILSERHIHTKKSAVDAATMDGSDESGSLTGTGVSLHHHLDGVGERAERIATRLGLAAESIDDLRLAGRLHDLGKVDRRFQAQLVGGDPVALEMLEEPLAKSLPGAGRVWLYPTGMRHEIASVAMVESNSEVLGAAHDKDLVLHLVGTHHGWARPLPPVIEDPEPQTLVYSFEGHIMQVHSDFVESPLALDMAERFWRLVERYGYHGLAWLEAILRLADHQQSAEEVGYS